MKASNVGVKYEQLKSAYLSYSDLERELKLKLTLNLDADQLDVLIGDVNDRLSLIEVNAPTISMSSSNEHDSSMAPESRESASVALTSVHA